MEAARWSLFRLVPLAVNQLALTYVQVRALAVDGLARCSDVSVH